MKELHFHTLKQSIPSDRMEVNPRNVCSPDTGLLANKLKDVAPDLRVSPNLIRYL